MMPDDEVLIWALENYETDTNPYLDIWEEKENGIHYGQLQIEEGA